MPAATQERYPRRGDLTTKEDASGPAPTRERTERTETDYTTPEQPNSDSDSNSDE